MVYVMTYDSTASYDQIRTPVTHRLPATRITFINSFFNLSVIIRASLEFDFARESEACTNDCAIIHSFKTKNIDRARKRREGRKERKKDKRREKTKVEGKKEKQKETKYERMFSIFCINCYGKLCFHSRGRKKQAWRRNSGVLTLLYALRTLPGCSESDRAPRLKPKFNWRRRETKEDRK